MFRYKSFQVGRKIIEQTHVTIRDVYMGASTSIIPKDTPIVLQGSKKIVDAKAIASYNRQYPDDPIQPNEWEVACWSPIRCPIAKWNLFVTRAKYLKRV